MWSWFWVGLGIVAVMVVVGLGILLAGLASVSAAADQMFRLDDSDGEVAGPMSM